MYTKKETGYYVNRHSCFLLPYHVVLVTKYRKPALQGKVKELVYGIIRDILEERGCTLKELNGEPDHIHILFDAGPEVQVLDMVRVIRSTSGSRYSGRTVTLPPRLEILPGIWWNNISGNRGRNKRKDLCRWHSHTLMRGILWAWYSAKIW